MTIGERIRNLRKELSLSQTEFGARIGLKQAVIGQMEHGTRNITDRTILLICERFHVNEEWLRSGNGPRHFEDENTAIMRLADEYSMNALDRKIIECYLKLNPAQRTAIQQYVRNLVEAVAPESSYEAIRRQYFEETPAAIAARNGETDHVSELVELYDRKPRTED